MAEPHLDHPGEITWFPGSGPARVLGDCPHAACPHNMTQNIAWGPDFEHYVLDQCDVATDEGCSHACRAWFAEYPLGEGPKSRQRGPWRLVDLAVSS